MVQRLVGWFAQTSMRKFNAQCARKLMVLLSFITPVLLGMYEILCNPENVDRFRFILTCHKDSGPLPYVKILMNISKMFGIILAR